ncbi:PaaI family thioesterase [Paracoccus sp. Z118]|uniref:PaaI family thioesterase n=1 Tax=Paracoccus sp. Z118 TaxID=2851017 RepID=UPI001C2BEF7A|nr:PaaI family thioesterase [Paracoccus sp. Z118]MBV0891324.1 PaaI family thioesterase [Paracoccus sp. Z118]
MDETRLRDSFARQTMMATLGAEMLEAGKGRVVIAAPIGGHVLQQHGAGHAGLAFSIGDSAAGYAALSTMPDGAEVMTVEMKINLMAPAMGDRLVAEGRVVRAGRRIVVVAADVWAETEGGRKHVAMLQGTMIPVTP